MKQKKEYLIVDGYNIVYSWKELEAIAQYSLQDARERLIEILSNYRGYRAIEIILVFDAHKQKGNLGSYELIQEIHVVYTKESQTADSFIERFSAINAKHCNITVATSDHLEQIIIIGRGANRISANDLLQRVNVATTEIKKNYTENKPIKKNELLDNLDPKTAAFLEKLRRQK